MIEQPPSDVTLPAELLRALDIIDASITVGDAFTNPANVNFMQQALARCERALPEEMKDEIAIRWHILDIEDDGEDDQGHYLSDLAKRDVIRRLKRNHDCTVGITHQVVDQYVDWQAREHAAHYTRPDMRLVPQEDLVRVGITHLGIDYDKVIITTEELDHYRAREEATGGEVITAEEYLDKAQRVMLGLDVDSIITIVPPGEE